MNKIPYTKLNIIIIPTDYCNMNCVYCFNGRRTANNHITMATETLEKVYDSTLPFYDIVNFIWHGGEPLSSGIDFFINAFELQKEKNTYETKIRNSIQSNLSLVNKEYIELFKKYNVVIGGSYDGINNEKTRHNSDNILNGYSLVKDAGIETGLICVVQKNNIDTLIDDYNWFKNKSINYTVNQYLSSDSYDELQVDPSYYSSKLCDFFDYWFNDNECNIRVRYFETFLNYFINQKKEQCTYNSCLGRFISIRPNGDIYPCNRDFSDKYCYGNVFDYQDIHECFNSEGFNSLLEDSFIRRNTCKEICDIYDFCTGGCNSCASTAGDMQKNNEYYCRSLRTIYKHIEAAINSYLDTPIENLPNNINPRVIRLLSKHTVQKTNGKS